MTDDPAGPWAHRHPLRWLAIALLAATMQVGAAWGQGERPSGVSRTAEEVFRFPAREARQAVAADRASVYVIDNTQIGIYDRTTGERTGGWVEDEAGPLTHLNSAIIIDGRLIAAHSNYPDLPQLSSLESWTLGTLDHHASVSLGQSAGSLVWADRRDGYWWLGFAHYAGRGSPPDRDPSWSQLVKADDQFRFLESFAFPEALIEEFAGYSASGGAWGPDGRLYVTGHDAPKLYALSLPERGSHLVWEETISIPAEGQGFAWDLEEPWVLYTIERSTREVVVSRIPN